MVREVGRVLGGEKTPQNGQQSPRKGEERLRQVLLQFQSGFEEEGREALLRDREIKPDVRSIYKFCELLDYYGCQLKGGSGKSVRGSS
ncbi:hypothetical protein AKJ47_03030 [candidate division MSBL1 archaeon SCGC-AAA261G05]|nr:hypothetical protein AKJ47_03030 [candidate division MSBL1 archaeon SCGC-AAA261G05]KXB04367.1 hypothetical protein AKJ48_02860 [candidate division MSBL1 archaeon SCGC-AAA261O19]